MGSGRQRFPREFLTKKEFSSDVESLVVRVRETRRYEPLHWVVYENDRDRYPVEFECSDSNCKSNRGFTLFNRIKSAIEKRETKAGDKMILCGGCPDCVSHFECEIEIGYKNRD